MKLIIVIHETGERFITDAEIWNDAAKSNPASVTDGEMRITQALYDALLDKAKTVLTKI